MIGQSLSILMPGGTGVFTPVLDRLRAGEVLERVESVRVARDGRVVHVSTLGTAVRDAEGRVIGALAVVRDISALKRADLQRETTEARLRAVIDSAVDAIIVIDVRGGGGGGGGARLHA
ncbi:MAG: PAS domain S-box protein, partial [Acidimicrobiia bacterium]|nr:PAS domain S-box protein [Acidimicrobiia bacterium]